MTEAPIPKVLAIPFLKRLPEVFLFAQSHTPLKSPPNPQSQTLVSKARHP